MKSGYSLVMFETVKFGEVEKDSYRGLAVKSILNFYFSSLEVVHCSFVTYFVMDVRHVATVLTVKSADFQYEAFDVIVVQSHTFSFAIPGPRS